MMRRALVIFLLPMLAGCGARLGTGSSSVECAPYARALTGLQLYGDAADWWEQADGRYIRAPDPVAGGVLVFRRSSRLPYGHVAVVRAQVSPREIRVDQANWVHRRVTHDEAVIDVSPSNDWSAVRVWWDPVGAMGSSTYATYGFILPEAHR